jgi:hypothetical protein
MSLARKEWQLICLIVIWYAAEAAQQGGAPAVVVRTPTQFKLALEGGAEHVVVQEHLTFSKADFLDLIVNPGPPITAFQLLPSTV